MVNGDDVFAIVLAGAFYQADLDLNMNGAADLGDESIANANLGRSFAPNELSDRGNIVGWCGYLYEESTGMWLARHRWQIPELGRWANRDPISYAGGGQNLYEYVNGNPVFLQDATGLTAAPMEPMIEVDGVEQSVDAIASRIEECEKTVETALHKAGAMLAKWSETMLEEGGPLTPVEFARVIYAGDELSSFVDGLPYPVAANRLASLVNGLTSLPMDVSRGVLSSLITDASKAVATITFTSYYTQVALSADRSDLAGATKIGKHFGGIVARVFNTGVFGIGSALDFIIRTWGSNPDRRDIIFEASVRKSAAVTAGWIATRAAMKKKWGHFAYREGLRRLGVGGRTAAKGRVGPMVIYLGIGAIFSSAAEIGLNQGLGELQMQVEEDNFYIPRNSAMSALSGAVLDIRYYLRYDCQETCGHISDRLLDGSDRAEFN